MGRRPAEARRWSGIADQLLVLLWMPCAHPRAQAAETRSRARRDALTQGVLPSSTGADIQLQAETCTGHLDGMTEEVGHIGRGRDADSAHPQQRG